MEGKKVESREKDLEHVALNEMEINSLPSELREEETEEMRQRKWRIWPSKITEQSSCELTETEASTTGRASVCTRSPVYVL